MHSLFEYEPRINLEATGYLSSGLLGLIAVLSNELESKIDSLAQTLEFSFPELVASRAREVAGAFIVLQCGKDLDCLRENSKKLKPGVADEILWAYLDLCDDHKGVYDQVVQLTGHRSIGVDVDLLLEKKLDLGRYQPNWKQLHDEQIAYWRSQAEIQRDLSESERLEAKKQERIKFLTKEIQYYVSTLDSWESYPEPTSDKNVGGTLIPLQVLKENRKKTIQSLKDSLAQAREDLNYWETLKK